MSEYSENPIPGGLSYAGARLIAQCKGWILLNHLKSLSDAAAQALAQHEGDLYLDGKAEEAVELARKRLAKQK